MNNKKQLKNLAAIAFFILPFSFASCNKDSSCSPAHDSCYDEKMYQTHKDDYCTTDCIGVTGCDGKIYCNECEANRKGISIKKD